MITHAFVCDDCNIEVTDIDTRKVHICPQCGCDMRWNLVGNASVCGDYEHISESLAIHPDQTMEHKIKFPDIDVLPDGRLRFTSVRQQEQYANSCGFDKKEQRKHNLGKQRIA
jgi:predicted ATP-dependent serine protease